MNSPLLRSVDCNTPGVHAKIVECSRPRRALQTRLRIGINSNAIALCNINISINRLELRLHDPGNRR